MPARFFIATVLVTLSSATIGAAPAKISRRDLLTADIHPQGQLAKVMAQEITLPPLVKAPKHTHDCPVVGLVTRGKIAYQIDGQPSQILTEGTAFYEPANTKIARFDNLNKGKSTFTAFYLCDSADNLLVRLVPPD